MSESFVSLNNLTLAYEDTVAVPKLNLDIQKGELLTLLGPSGCGKTTTMRAIAGLLNPRSGTIVIDGADVTKVPANKRGVGLVFQSYALFPHLSAFENVAFGLRLRKISNGEIKRRGGQSLETVELGEFANRKPSELSGGQQQRLCIARAIAVNPEVILMDEPCSALDPIATAKIEDLMISLSENYTIVIVTHSMQQAARISQKTAFFHLGDLIEMDTTAKIFTNPNNPKTQDYITGRFG